MEAFFQDVAPLEYIVSSVMLFIPKLIMAIIIFLTTLYVAKLGYRYVEIGTARRKVDSEVSLLLARITQIAIIVFGTIWALSAVDFNVTSFVAGLGIVGFTVGFALKDVAENFVAGILLLIQQPFNIGDAVEAGGYSGTVSNIEIRSTTIRTFDGLLVIIPNAQVYSNPITNFSKVPHRRINVNVGVGYETDLDKATDILLDIANKLPGIMDDPAPFVVFDEFGDSSINATLYFWVRMDEVGYFDSLDGVIKGIKTAFERNNINIPYPIRTVYMEAK
ncbi:MAG: mechanosensitive ion channel [Anaerolineae bacterium]|nr:mechanosensitive ion channel [Anaerolineae bacterium]